MSAPDRNAAPGSGWRPGTIALAYALAAALWVLASERLFPGTGAPGSQFAVRGLIFVGASAALLYLVLRLGRRGEAARIERLEQQAGGFLAMFESNPHPMWIYDLDTLAFLAVNDAAVAHYGYTREEFLGMTIADIRPVADVPALLRNVARVERGLDRAGVWRHRKKDGTAIEVEIISSALTIDGRRAELVLAHDVTAQRAAQRKVEAAEERLRLALSAANQGLYDVDLRTGESTVNDAYAQMLGYAPGELRETTAEWLARLHPDDRERVAAVYADCIAGRLPEFRAEFRQRTRQGDWKWILSLGRVMERDASGAPLRMLGTHTDIDEQKQAQARIRRLGNLYAALSQCNEAILRIGDRGELLREVCRIAVDHGGLRMAWIGELRGERVVPVASHGAHTDYAERLDIGLDPGQPSGRGPTAEAVRGAHNVLCEDIEGDARMEPWRERALACGFRASAAFPLRSGGRTVGVLNLYASLPRYFDAELVSLLDQLARDLSFALDRLALQADREAAERRFRATVDHAADAVFIADPDGRIVDANIRACESLGYTREELLSMGVGDVDPEVRAMGEDVGRVFRAAAVAESQLLLSRHRRKDGSEFPVEVRVAGVRLADGDYVIGMARDITERLRAERALRESERRFRQISRAMSDIAYSCRRAADGSFEIDWMMGAAERITGYTVEEIVDMRCWECLVAPEDLDLFRREVTGLAAGRSGRCELRLRRKDGGIAWVSAVAECVAEADDPNRETGDPAAHRLYGGLVDITARKQAEADLRDSEARLRRVVDEMPVMLDAFDAEGRLIYWNRECERVTGYPAEQMLGNPDALALLYPDAGYRERMLAEYRSRGLDSRDFEWDLVARDGSLRRIAWSNISAVVPVPGWAAWGVGVDVTARREAEAAAANNAQRLQLLSRRLLSVQEDERRALARELHDEVGQQLAALKINLDMLLRGSGAELDRRRLSDSIEIADQTIERIRDTALNLLPAVLEDLGLTSALNWYARRQAERSGCRIHVGSSIPPLAKDVETALFRIVQEAVNNAVRHGAAGRIDVALDMVGDAVRVSVHDDGCGFDVGGSAATGVGLLSMRERTELLGGSFEVQSQAGGGTWVRARIPLERRPG